MSRLDIYIAKKYNFSRQKAQDYIQRGYVLVDGMMQKSSFLVRDENNVELFLERKFISRAGEKLFTFLQNLAQNYDVFSLPEGLQDSISSQVRSRHKIFGKRILDVGSSTGGFTEVFLMYGARSIDCVDVGRDQLHRSLREHSNIRVFENLDIRDFARYVTTSYDLLSCDVSFISLRKIFSALQMCCNEMILLFKPQFELGMDFKRSKKGVLCVKESDIKIHLENFRIFLKTRGFRVLVCEKSKISGRNGNWEYFFWIKQNESRL